MLERSAAWLKPGGTLVYSVCSLEPEEGEAVARAFLAGRADYRQEEERRLLPGWLEAEGGADSFYIARFTRLSGG
jgi:16S rRNA (cytosine967-C5)-methyltransferase